MFYHNKWMTTLSFLLVRFSGLFLLLIQTSYKRHWRLYSKQYNAWHECTVYVHKIYIPFVNFLQVCLRKWLATHLSRKWDQTTNPLLRIYLQFESKERKKTWITLMQLNQHEEHELKLSWILKSVRYVTLPNNIKQH